MTDLFDVGGVRYTFSDWQGLGMDEEGQQIDPLLASTDPGDFEFFVLQPQSPAIDTGICTGVFFDFAGTVRPQGQTCDVGAFEHVP